MNRMRGQMKIAAIKAPRYGEERRNMLEDIATATGATFISKDSGIRLGKVEISHLGTAKSIEILKNHTTIVDGGGDEEATEQAIESLKSRVESCDSLHDAERLQDRITRLASGVSVIRVGGATEVEMVEKKHRVEDALEAGRSAQLEGIVPGGGMALAMSSLNLKGPTKDATKQKARQILYDACQEPLRKILENAGMNPDVALLKLNQLKQQNPHVPFLGLDVASGEPGDMLKLGIIDPTKVTKTALTNAVSVAGTLLTTNCIVYKEHQEENKK